MGASNEFIRSRVIEACKDVELRIKNHRLTLREVIIRDLMSSYRKFSWTKLRFVTIYPTREEVLEYLHGSSATLSECYRWSHANTYLAKQLETTRKIRSAAEDGVHSDYFNMTADEYELIAKHYKER